MMNESDLKDNMIIPIENLIELENYKVEFTCMICISIVIKPLQLKCCDHLICTDCLKKYIRLSENKPCCPLCKHSLIYNTPNKIIMRIYSNLKLKCLNCESILKTENYFSHFYNECINKNSEGFSYCKKCKEIVKSDLHKCNFVKEIKEIKLHEHCLKFTNIRKHINYEKLGWICDYCEMNKRPDDKSYHCNRCGFDICEDCVDFVKDKIIKENIHSHILILSKAVDWVCNICKSDRKFSFAWSCAACDFDCCIKCYWINNDNLQNIK